MIYGILMTSSCWPTASLIILEVCIDHNIHSIHNNLSGLLSAHLILEVDLLLKIYLAFDDSFLDLVVNYVILYVFILEVETKIAVVAGSCGG